jgi:hypothetical protein
MKKYIVYLSVLLFFFAVGCKKSEEQKSADDTATKTGQTAGRPKRKHGPAAIAALQIYHDETLVKSVEPSEYPALATTKMKVGDKDVKGLPLKDLLAKYELKGKNVIIGGPQRSATITWQQANSNDIYVYLGPKQNTLQISAPKTMNLNLPNRLVRLTVSDQAQTAAAGQSKKTGN